MIKLTGCASRIFSSYALASALLATLALPLQAQSPDALTEQYGNWTVQCRQIQAVDDGPAQGLCAIVQELRQQETNQRIVSVSISQLATGESAELAMVVPFGLNVRELVKVLVEEEVVASLPFKTCLPTGCLAGDLIDNKVLEVFREHAAAKVVFPLVDANGAFDVEISLMGFTSAWARLVSFANESQ